MLRSHHSVTSHVSFGVRVLVPLLIAAEFLACSGSVADSVAPPSSPPAQIAISPNSPAVAVGSQLALQAQVHDASGQLVPGATVFWSSNDTTIVAVSSAGVVTGNSVGTTQIAASSGGQSAVVPVTVVPIAVASVAIAPSSATITVGGSVVLQGIAYDAGGSTLAGRSVVWATSAPQVATVDQNGKVSGVTAGKANITGTIEGKTATATVTVTIVPVSAVTISPTSAALDAGQSTSLTATATDANGNALTGRTITWASASSSIATVTAAGVVTGVAAGTTTISATAEGKTGSAQVVVTGATPPPASVARVTVAPATLTLTKSQSTQTLTVTAVDANGKTLNCHQLGWKSSDKNVTVKPTGGLTASVSMGTKRGIGAATVTATCDGVDGTSRVSYVN